MMLDTTIDRARGYMLLGIIYMHAIFAFVSTREPAGVAAAFVQIKLLAPHVSVFFLLSGMGARHIARRNFWQIARQSAALVLVAILSHVTGFALLAVLHGTGAGLEGSAWMLLGPVLLGTGYTTFVAWFFLALAMARMLTYLFYRSPLAFLGIAFSLAALILLEQRLGLADNIWEWRTWPAAFLFFLIGTRLPADLAIPAPVGLAAGAGAALLTWFNRPGLLIEGPCLACDVTFVSQPMVGEFGSIPVFVLQELLFFAFLIAMAQLKRPGWMTRPVQFVGRNSAQFLLLNGWVIVALYPWLLPLLPARESPALLVALFAGGALLHWLLFRLLRRPLNLLLVTSFQAVDQVGRLAQLLRPAREPAGGSAK